MLNNSFSFNNTPKIFFGKDNFDKLPDLIANYGKKALIITGGSSLYQSGHYKRLTDALAKRKISYSNLKVTDEPSPDLVDQTSKKYRKQEIDVVVAIGGGSVIDAGKAISAMLVQEESVMAYLEGVGEGKEHSGNKIPFIAVPTTSGTGSEATKNAVLSRVGDNGFKKSLRHDNFVPNIALLDPKLTISCPAEITAASGLDALTQLLGAYLSTKASPMTDSLALTALRYAGQALVPAATTDSENVNLRAKMSYASLISGITLANAGLGIVHGLASSVGGYFEIPHGVLCGSLLGEATKMNINLLQAKNDNKFLKKYAKAGAALVGDQPSKAQNNIDHYCQLLIKRLNTWIEELNIPSLSEYGISEDDLDKIAQATGYKNNPVALSNEQIKKLVKSRL